MENIKPADTGRLQPKRGFKKLLLTLAAGTLLIGGGIAYWEYFYVHYKGYDKGILLRFSLKGDVIPTYEGVLDRRMGQSGYSDADTFFFSVADKKLADSLQKVVGEKVLVHYIQYHTPLPWRGDNYNGRNQEDGQYLVDSLIKAEDPADKDF
jgi:hypothetical protein